MKSSKKLWGTGRASRRYAVEAARPTHPTATTPPGTPARCASRGGPGPEPRRSGRRTARLRRDPCGGGKRRRASPTRRAGDASATRPRSRQPPGKRGEADRFLRAKPRVPARPAAGPGPRAARFGREAPETASGALVARWTVGQGRMIGHTSARLPTPDSGPEPGARRRGRSRRVDMGVPRPFDGIGPSTSRSNFPFSTTARRNSDGRRYLHDIRLGTILPHRRPCAPISSSPTRPGARQTAAPDFNHRRATRFHHMTAPVTNSAGGTSPTSAQTALVVELQNAPQPGMPRPPSRPKCR